MPEPRLYLNEQAADLERELAEAAGLGIEGASFPSDAFDAVVEAGEPLIYVILEDRTLVIWNRLVGGRDAHHSVIAGGEAVLAAGEMSLAVVAEEQWVLNVNEKSGHYRPDRECLSVVQEVMEALGFTVPAGAVASYTED